MTVTTTVKFPRQVMTLTIEKSMERKYCKRVVCPLNLPSVMFTEDRTVPAVNVRPSHWNKYPCGLRTGSQKKKKNENQNSIVWEI